MEPLLDQPRKDHAAFHHHAQIAAVLEGCMQTFQLLSSVMEANYAVHDEKCLTLKAHWQVLNDWATENYAVNGALDHALRKSSRLKEQVIEHLEDIDANLQSVLEDIRMKALPLLSPALVEDTYLSYFQPRINTRDPGQTPVGEETVQYKLNRFLPSFERLRRLSIGLYNPFPEDIFADGVLQGDDESDIQLSSRMFPEASSATKRRLGHLHWQRRCILRSLGARDRSTIGGAHDITSLTSEIAERFSMRSSDIPQRYRTVMERPLSDHRAVFRRYMSTSMSETASSSGTFVSKPDSGYVTHAATSVEEFDGSLPSKVLTVPLPPATLVKGESFICPYCGLPIIVGEGNGSQNVIQQDMREQNVHPRSSIMDVSSSPDWATHVFADLETYVCTSEECETSPAAFALRDDWFAHELFTHHLPKVWVCESCGTEWKVLVEFQQHVVDEHRLPKDQVATVAQLCSKYTDSPPDQVICSLCHFKCSFDAYKNHVASHLEQFALTALQSGELRPDDGFESPRGVTMTLEYANKYTLLQDFILEQQHTPESAKEPEAVLPNEKLPRTHLDPSRKEPPTANSTSTSRPTRPRLTSREFSYTYMQRVRELKAEDAAKSAATSPLAHWKSAEPTASANSDREAICTLQPPRNTDFVGRINDMAIVHQNLQDSGQVCALVGIGGLGKSAIAAEYTWKFKSCYSYIFWVPAETAMICADSFSQIALRVVPNARADTEEERLVNMGREFLENTTDRWLVVFDNVDEGFDLRRFLPSNLNASSGSVLITTRKQQLDLTMLSAKPSRIDLNVLTLEESRELLLQSAKADHEVGELRFHPEYKLAGEIAKRAERLPLALSLIAGYVLASECTLSDFVEIWNERQRSTPVPNRDENDPTANADSAMDTVWNIGLREVTTDARQLLNILAFLDSDTIQKNLLVGPHESQSLELLHSSSPIRWRRMTKELSRRRLIKIESREGQEVLSIHRKLQAKILEELNRQGNAAERDPAFQRVFTLIRSRFPRPSPTQVPEPEKWPICRQYLPHILSIKRIWLSGAVKIHPSVELAQLISDAGIDLWERCLTVEGLELLRSAETLLNQGGFKENLLRANLHVVISLLLQDSGIVNLAECRDRIKQVIDIRLEYRRDTQASDYTREDEILLFNAWSDYACVLLQYNKFSEASPLFDNCLERYKAWGPPQQIPYEYAKYYHHKAYCLMYDGDFEKAVPMAEQGLHWVEKATGPSAASNRWRFDLACLVLQSGDRQRALALHKKVLEARIALHGKFGLLTLQSYYAVGAAHSWLDQVAEAESYLRRILDIDKARPGLCTEAALAQVQYHLSQILRKKLLTIRSDSPAVSPANEAKYNPTAEEATYLAQNARKVLLKPHPLDPLLGVAGAMASAEEPYIAHSELGLSTVPEEHELALFDHLQPIFDGRFTGLHLLPYLQQTRPM